MDARRDVFQAIADPTRREIIGLLAQEPLTMNGVSDNFTISRPAISKHMKILQECGLVSIHRHGRERYCKAELEPLNEVSDWVERYRKIWTERLDSLEHYLNQLQAKNQQDDDRNK